MIEMKVSISEGSFDGGIGRFLLGSGVFAATTAIGSGVMGNLGGAAGSMLGGWAGAKIASGKFQKGLLLGMGFLNGIDYLFTIVTGKPTVI